MAALAFMFMYVVCGRLADQTSLTFFLVCSATYARYVCVELLRVLCVSCVQYTNTLSFNPLEFCSVPCVQDTSTSSCNPLDLCKGGCLHGSVHGRHLFFDCGCGCSSPYGRLPAPAFGFVAATRPSHVCTGAEAFECLEAVASHPCCCCCQALDLSALCALLSASEVSCSVKKHVVFRT